MDQNLNDEHVVRRYLLGEMAEQEREQLERRLLVDADYSALVSVLEEDLIEDYVSSRLEAEDALKFESIFLKTPEGVEQVRLARNLRAYSLKEGSGRLPEPLPSHIEAGPKPISLMDYLRSKTSAARTALAAAAVVAVLLGASLVLLILRLQDEAAQAPPSQSQVQELEGQLAEQQARNEELAKSLRQEQELRAKLEQELAVSKRTDRGPASSTIAALMLSPGRVRGGGQSRRLIIDSGTSRASFSLSIRKTSHKSFRASIQTESGRTVWSGAAQPSSSGGEVRFTVPANLLSSGDYAINLEGAEQGEYEDIASYYFSVVKR